MKLFSRKALAAVATSVALTTAGLSAPAFAEETAPGAEAPAPAATATATATETVTVAPEGSADFLGSSNNQDEDSLSSNPKEIREWVAVFTAIIGALSTAFVFIDRLGR
ncbi:MAG: hypothetical protein GX859_08835 [Corynebacterium humireducens]|jgi:hypothetical protein|uniref:Secreted protein n=1 Tax=Corynebacterium humireducens TaxID=1223514 RepID=A0A7X6PNY3_9CORY|nr:hypothetical protein [Corynebacterium humireducens]